MSVGRSLGADASAPPPPPNGLVFAAFRGKISGLDPISGPRLLCDLGRVTTFLRAPVIPKASFNAKTLNFAEKLMQLEDWPSTEAV